MHEHKASGFILTLNEKLTNYSSNLINMQTDICYLGVNSRGIFVGGGALTHRPLVPSAAGVGGCWGGQLLGSHHTRLDVEPPLSLTLTPTHEERDLLEMETDSGWKEEGWEGAALCRRNSFVGREQKGRGDAMEEPNPFLGEASTEEAETAVPGLPARVLVTLATSGT